LPNEKEGAVVKKIVLVGGAGTVGAILTKGLKDKYEIVIMDVQKPDDNVAFIEGDAVDFDGLLETLPDDADTIVNLLRIESTKGIDSKAHFDDMTALFFNASYYLLLAAQTKGIRRVVFASSNHVTDGYEKDGYSLLPREITVDDFPKTNSLYGVLKFASEQLGYLFAKEGKLSVINLRIASVPPAEKRKQLNDRLERTLLADEDLVALVQASIETDKNYGTYYGVSDNRHKPWSTLNAYQELGFGGKASKKE
jgi:nucleoside-diphosphate-sugar epimerase